MKIAIYARDQHVAAEAFAAGLKLHGHRAILRSLPDYGDNCLEQFDMVVVVGLRGRGRRIFSEYIEAGVPVIVVDYGYLDRVNGVDDYAGGHWQVSPGGLNVIPQFECPADRFEALGLELQLATQNTAPIVLCGQAVGDAAHPFDTQEKLDEWVASVPHDEFRPHPLTGADLESLDELFARAGQIVTWNSNIGNDALLAGVPVEALGPATYSGVSLDDRAAYFARLAYGQWTVGEMAEGLTAEFLLERWLSQEEPAQDKPDQVPAVALTMEKVGKKYVVKRADGSVVKDGLTKAEAEALVKGA